MMLNRPVTACLGLIAAAMLTGSTSNGGDEPAPTRPLAKAIRTEVPEAGSVEDALHIRRASGIVELSEKVPGAKLTIDLYRDGKKVDSHSLGARVGPDQAAGEARFSVQVIDLDYLPLGGGAKGHLRIVRTLRLGGLVSSSATDVPKDVFGGRLNSSGFQPFGPRSGSANEVPLFFMILETRPDESGQDVQHGGGMVEEVIRANKHNDILVGKLVVDLSKTK